MMRGPGLIAIAVAGLLAFTACAPASPPASPAEDGSAASVLLTLPKDSYDPLIGKRIEPGRLGVAPNGCVTVAGAYLRVGYGSALLDGGRTAALTDIGTFRIGDTLPALYGYRLSYTAATLPKALSRCGAGRYVSAPNAVRSSTNRASNLLVDSPSGGTAGTLNGLLDVGGNGCLRVGGQYLLASPDSSLRDDGTTLVIPGSGSFPIPSWMPTLSATSVFYTAATLPPELARCGPGGYVAVSVQQDRPVLVFDPVNDSTRMVVRPASARVDATTSIAPAVIGTRNTCVTIGDAFLSAPHGSTVFDHGRRIRLTGIGTFRIGATSPALHGRSRTYTDRTVPTSLIDCGGGRYLDVVAG